MGNWHRAYTAEELAARQALTARLDPAFEQSERRFYETRTEPQLRSLMAQAWNCCESDAYQMARTYLEKLGHTITYGLS